MRAYAAGMWIRHTICSAGSQTDAGLERLSLSSPPSYSSSSMLYASSATLSRLAILFLFPTDHEMLLPDPSQSIRIVVLVLGKPQLTLLRNDVKDFALHIGKVRIAAFLARFVDIELEERGAHKQDNSGVCSRHTGAVAGR
jgi:hypothetical protein